MEWKATGVDYMVQMLFFFFKWFDPCAETGVLGLTEVSKGSLTLREVRCKSLLVLRLD